MAKINMVIVSRGMNYINNNINVAKIEKALKMVILTF